MRFSFLVLLLATAAWAEGRSVGQVKRILSRSQALGAHGLGFNSKSLKQLSKELTAADLPALLELYEKNRVGVEFALISLCEPGISAAVEWAHQKKMDSGDAQDTLNRIADLDHCEEPAREHAKRASSELREYLEKQAALEQAKQKADSDNDARIQANGIKMMLPRDQQNLTQEERREVFERSIKALRMEGKRTPEQEQLYQRMYKSMVLGEPSGSQNE